LADSSALTGIASANNFEPLVSGRYAELMDVISDTRSASLLRLMDIAVVASPTPLKLEQIADSASGGVSFYRAAGAPPRLLPPPQVLTLAGSDEVRAAMAEPNFDPAETLLLEAGESAATA